MVGPAVDLLFVVPEGPEVNFFLFLLCVRAPFEGVEMGPEEGVEMGPEPEVDAPFEGVEMGPKVDFFFLLAMADNFLSEC